MGLATIVTSPGGLLRVLVIAVTVVCFAKGSHWHYGEEDDWPGKCKQGDQQSPINLQKHRADKKTFNPLQLINYDRQYKANLFNNGHSVVLTLIISEADDGNITAGRPFVRGGGLPDEYILDHLHFHWGSEHTIHSNRYPLEMHLVHFSKKFNSTFQAVGSNSQQALAVLGVLFDLEGDINKGFNKAFMTALNEVEKKPQTKISLSEPVTVNSFLPKDRTGFFRYEGSLTTPNCDECVIWTVFTDVGHITEEHVQLFHDVHSDTGPLPENFRSLQNLNGRVITLRESTMVSKAPFSFANNGLIILILLSLALY